MAGAYKRASDKARGASGKYTIWWFGADGKRYYDVGLTDKKRSLEIANAREVEARQVREGLVDPRERQWREAALKPIAEHIEGYRLGLLAKGDTKRHADNVARYLRRLLADAGIASVGEIVPELVQQALGRLRESRSPRSANFALGSVKAWVRWLEHNNRVREIPRGLFSLSPYSEKIDRKRIRRAASEAEIELLLKTAEAGPDEFIYGKTKSRHSRITVSGPDRAMLYRLAFGTGFRANELRSLVPESFKLDGNEPTVTVDAGYTKNGETAVQPILASLAVMLKPFLEGKPPGHPILVVPVRTADILRRDLERAGIPYVDSAGRVLDFHALRHSYITHLIQRGVNPKIVQKLARHSTITLTLDLYTHLEAGDIRKALEGPET